MDCKFVFTSCVPTERTQDGQNLLPPDQLTHKAGRIETQAAFGLNHAGRNLLVKDFCYLRTVNVPAAVRSLSGWNIGTKVALDE